MLDGGRLPGVYRAREFSYTGSAIARPSSTTGVARDEDQSHTSDMADWYTTREHQPGVWLVSEPPHVNCFLVAGRERALLVDTGLGFAPIREVVDGLTGLPVVVVNTHYHWDQVGGNPPFSDVAIHEAGEAKLRRGPDMDKIRPYADWARHVLERFGEFRALDEELFWLATEETTPRPLPDGFDPRSWTIAP